MKATVKLFCLITVTDPWPRFQKRKLPSWGLQSGTQGNIVSLMHSSEKFSGRSFATAIAKYWSSCFLAVSGLTSESGVSSRYEVFRWRSPLEWGHAVWIRRLKPCGRKHSLATSYLLSTCPQRAERGCSFRFSAPAQKFLAGHLYLSSTLIRMRCSEAESLNCGVLLNWFFELLGSRIHFAAFAQSSSSR